MAASDHDHTRCHASYFGDADLLAEIGADPLEQVLRYSAFGEHVPGVDFVSEVFFDKDAGRMFVFWSDGVANDWCQEVRDMPDAFEFLRDLTACCMREDSLFTEAEVDKWATR